MLQRLMHFGQCLEAGIGVPKDVDEVRRHFDLAVAAQGNR
jgi:hypothetical protein